jgi:phosphoribosylformylglycinamidine synthase
MTARIGVITFPGSNGDHDAVFAFRENLGVPVRLIDYRETDLGDVDALVLPGGFSYGDHLRCGAIARFAPVMTPLRAFVARGGPVLGICNGFQILTEAHLLPGALLRNKTLRFHCHWTQIRIEQPATAWTNRCSSGQVLRLPVAHGDGAYFADGPTLERLEGEGRVVARYCGASRDISPTISDETERAEVMDPAAVINEAKSGVNPNGSVNRIAGVTNDRGNVVGLMPHPERAADALVGGEDGLLILQSGLAALQVGA